MNHDVEWSKLVKERQQEATINEISGRILYKNNPLFFKIKHLGRVSEYLC